MRTTLRKPDCLESTTREVGIRLELRISLLTWPPRQLRSTKAAEFQTYNERCVSQSPGQYLLPLFDGLLIDEEASYSAPDRLTFGYFSVTLWNELNLLVSQGRRSSRPWRFNPLLRCSSRSKLTLWGPASGEGLANGLFSPKRERKRGIGSRNAHHIPCWVGLQFLA